MRLTSSERHVLLRQERDARLGFLEAKEGVIIRGARLVNDADSRSLVDYRCGKGLTSGAIVRTEASAVAKHPTTAGGGYD